MRLALAIACALAQLALTGSAFASTPLPTKPDGNGNESTTGGGLMLGKAFTPHYAVAVLDISFNQVELFLLPKPTGCNDVLFANPPYVVVTVDTNGSPLLVGKPSLSNGQAFVQVDFHPAHAKKYYAIQPGASITFTHVDPAPKSKWRGILTVKRQHFEGQLFAYSGTFAATWCGKD